MMAVVSAFANKESNFPFCAYAAVGPFRPRNNTRDSTGIRCFIKAA